MTATTLLHFTVFSQHNLCLDRKFCITDCLCSHKSQMYKLLNIHQQTDKKYLIVAAKQNVPGKDVTTSVLLSRVSIVFWKPQRASTRSISKSTNKSLPRRLNNGCFCSSRTTMTSPGSIPGSWSPSDENRICCPSLEPTNSSSSSNVVTQIHSVHTSRFSLNKRLHVEHT